MVIFFNLDEQFRLERRFQGESEEQLQDAMISFIKLCVQLVDNPDAIYGGFMIIHDRKIRLYDPAEYLSEYDHLQW